MMNAKCFGVALLAALTVGCGEGRAIFNVDVHSFLFGTGRDTVPYLVPASTTLDTSSGQHINLPGAGSSIVDTRSEEHTSELQSRQYLVCRLLLEKENSSVATPALAVPGVMVPP